MTQERSQSQPLGADAIEYDGAAPQPGEGRGRNQTSRQEREDLENLANLAHIVDVGAALCCSVVLARSFSLAIARNNRLASTFEILALECHRSGREDSCASVAMPERKRGDCPVSPELASVFG